MGEHGGIGEGFAAIFADEGEASPFLVGFPFVIDIFIFTVAQAGDICFIFIEEEIGIVLTVVGFFNYFDIWLVNLLFDIGALVGGNGNFDLDFEALATFNAAGQSDQFVIGVGFTFLDEGVDSSGDLGGFGLGGGFINGEELAVAHEETAVADDVSDIGAFGGIDEAGVDIFRIVMEVRPVVEAVHIDNDDIGEFMWFEGADFITHVDSFGAEASGHGDRLFGGDNGGVIAFGFGEEGSETEFFEHVEIVVASGPIGTDADVEVGGEHFVEVGDTTGQFEIAGGAVGDTGASLFELIHFLGVDMDTVGGEEFGIKDAMFIEPRDDVLMIFFLALVDFEQ